MEREHWLRSRMKFSGMEDVTTLAQGSATRKSQYMWKGLSLRYHSHPHAPHQETEWCEENEMEREHWLLGWHWLSERAVPEPDGITFRAQPVLSRKEHLKPSRTEPVRVEGPFTVTSLPRSTPDTRSAHDCPWETWNGKGSLATRVALAE